MHDNTDSIIVPAIDDSSLHWKPCREHFPGPTRVWREWLLDTGSLTRRLVKLSQGNFNVGLVSEEWQLNYSPYLTKILGQDYYRQRMWSRKVILSGNQQPWVVAHTLVPQSSLETGLGRVKKLQTKPLGAFLFSHPELRRSCLDIARTPDGWGRCSLFELFDRPILVAEFFLTELISNCSASVAEK